MKLVVNFSLQNWDQQIFQFQLLLIKGCITFNTIVWLVFILFLQSSWYARNTNFPIPRQVLLIQFTSIQILPRHPDPASRILVFNWSPWQHLIFFSPKSEPGLTAKNTEKKRDGTGHSRRPANNDPRWLYVCKDLQGSKKRFFFCHFLPRFPLGSESFLPGRFFFPLLAHTRFCPCSKGPPGYSGRERRKKKFDSLQQSKHILVGSVVRFQDESSTLKRAEKKQD